MPQSASDRADDGPRATGNSLFVSAQDGLRLHVRAHGARTNRALPVICLPGLARTTVDFDTLALALSSDRERPRRVPAPAYPRPGQSGRGPTAPNYKLQGRPAEVASSSPARAERP